MSVWSKENETHVHRLSSEHRQEAYVDRTRHNTKQSLKLRLDSETKCDIEPFDVYEVPSAQK